MNSDVLRLNGVNGLLAKKRKKVRMVKNELIAKDQMMVAVRQVKLVKVEIFESRDGEP